MPRELIDTGRSKRFVRRDAAGQFDDVADVGRSLSQDRRRKAKRVVRWMAERTEPAAAGSAVTVEELYADYAEWCARRDGEDLGQNAFQRDFDRVREAPQLRGSIRKFGNRYYGIRLMTPVMLEARKRLQR